MLRWFLVTLVVIVSAWGIRSGPASLAVAAGGGDRAGQHMRAAYSPIHFKPAIESATDAQCLACHKEVLDDTVRPLSPAGIKAADSLAWYQQVSTYSGGQDTFHRRHLVTPMAKQLMNLKCNTCHEGHDPREEAPGSSATSAPQSDTGFTLRKQVNPETTCLKCHGQMNWPVMAGLTGPWHEVRDTFQNNCLSCHAAIRTNRHQVSYLNAEAIEKAGSTQNTGGDTCYGCHGGRPWYRIAYPYARNPWPGMPEATPEWARLRPRHSEMRFLIQAATPKPAGH
ncbi:MAG: hypothetical protein KJ787_07000 [Gammaproteobacteria bacterium]|nr:hypothetical protein [Gammaproteobacteria bacterium]MBU1646066.1 hypothetical protein [Gammaproteobacteria bacterium]MBU1972128.1 hypothetical protein [Gammaproteobacteria bacterium]